MASKKPLPACQFEDPNPRELWEMVLKRMLLAKLLALEKEVVPQ